MLYFNEDSNGFVQKQDFQVFAAIDVSLRETLQEFLRVNLREDNFLCKGGNFMVKLRPCFIDIFIVISDVSNFFPILRVIPLI